MDMFSMFTADAAAKHGHEFSRSQTMPPPGTTGTAAGAAQPNMRLPRSPLSVLPRARPQGSLVRPRQRPQSMKITMAELKEDPEGEKADEEEERRMLDAKIRSFTIPGAFQETPPSSRTSAEVPDVDVVRPSPSPSPLSASEDLPVVSKSTSDAASTSGDTTDASQLRRNANKPKVFYRLGRPHAERKHYLRPKCLLQVQETGRRFHRPVFDVVPGSRFNPRTKIGQKLRRLKKNKDGTGADDLVVVRSEHTHESSGDSEEEHDKEQDHEHETLNGREVMGTIQPAEDGPNAYITLGETVWKAFLDRSGSSYTLENTNNATERARWYVPKSKRPAVLNGAPREFSFASLQPGSKRHPIIANMSEGHLEFSEEYNSPLDPNKIVHTEESLRRLILVSGLWVYFCEGWSKHYDFHSAMATATRPVPGRSQSTRSGTSRGLKEMLRSRSPSRSPCPSIRCAASVSSDTRSREGSHDSTATATTATATTATVSPNGTLVRHSIHSTLTSQSTPTEARVPSPDMQVQRGRRRWSHSISTSLRRFSHSIKHNKEPVSPMAFKDDTIITADLVAVEDLPTPVNVDQHPLQKAFIQPTKTVVVSSSEPVVEEIPPLETVVPWHHKFAVYPDSPLPPKSPIRDALEKLEGTASKPPEVIVAPPQVDGPAEPLPTTPSAASMPHRFGLGDLARPQHVFTPVHQRSDSTSSSDGEFDPARSGWWSQYDRMVQKGTGSVVVPTSPY